MSSSVSSLYVVLSKGLNRKDAQRPVFCTLRCKFMKILELKGTHLEALRCSGGEWRQWRRDGLADSAIV
jgi:hypothetical protein